MDQPPAFVNRHDAQREPWTFVLVRAVSLALGSVVFCAALFPRFVPVMVALSALGVLTHIWAEGDWRRPKPNGLTVVAGALIVWIALSALWSGDTGGGLEKAGLIAAMVVCGWVIWQWICERSSLEAFIMHRAVSITFAITTLLIFMDLMSGLIGAEWVAETFPKLKPQASSTWLLRDGPNVEIAVDFYNRGIAGLILIMPAAAMSWRAMFPRPEQTVWRLSFTVPCGLLVLTAALSDCGTCKLASGAVTLALVASLIMSVQLLSRVVGGFSLAGLILAPLIALGVHGAFKHQLTALPNSISERIMIWRDAANAIAERPLAGHGIRSTRAAHRAFKAANPDLRRPYRVPFPGFHPHSGFLQIWRELGIFGVGLAAALLTLLGRAFVRHARRAGQQASVLAGVLTLVAALGVIATGWGLWQTWLIGLLVMLVPFYRLGQFDGVIAINEGAPT